MKTQKKISNNRCSQCKSKATHKIGTNKKGYVYLCENCYGAYKSNTYGDLF